MPPQLSQELYGSHPRRDFLNDQGILPYFVQLWLSILRSLPKVLGSWSLQSIFLIGTSICTGNLLRKDPASVAAFPSAFRPTRVYNENFRIHMRDRETNCCSTSVQLIVCYQYSIDWSEVIDKQDLSKSLCFFLSKVTSFCFCPKKDWNGRKLKKKSFFFEFPYGLLGTRTQN